MCALEAEEGFAMAQDGARLFYRVSGKGPFALVMPVNWGMDSYIYTKGLSSLEFWLALVTWDPRGVGRSDPVKSLDEFAVRRTAQDAAVVADAVGLDRSAVIGHSGGGSVALEYALRFPHRVSHLILVSTAPRWTYGGESPTDEVYPETEEEMRREVRDSLRQAVREPERFLPAMDVLLPRIRFSPERYRWTREFELATYDVRPRLREIGAPTLIIHGREDRVVPFEGARELHEGIHGSRLAVLDGCGHWPFVERRADFVKVVTGFLGLEAGPRRP